MATYPADARPFLAAVVLGIHPRVDPATKMAKGREEPRRRSPLPGPLRAHSSESMAPRKAYEVASGERRRGSGGNHPDFHLRARPTACKTCAASWKQRRSTVSGNSITREENYFHYYIPSLSLFFFSFCHAHKIIIALVKLHCINFRRPPR